MATDKDHIEALRNRLLAKMKEKEAEIAEIKAVYDSLGVAPKILEGKTLQDRVSPVSQQPQPRTLSNRNVTELVRQYVTDFNRDTVILIPEIVEWLKRQSVKGKDRSLYSAVHVILKKEVAKGADLHYTKGVGFYKGRQPESTLVAEGVNQPP